MNEFLVFTASTADASASGGNNSWWILILVYGAIIVGAYFLLSCRINPKRKEKRSCYAEKRTNR